MDQHKHNMIMGMLKTRMEHKPENEKLAEIHDKRIQQLECALVSDEEAERVFNVKPLVLNADVLPRL